MAFYTSLDTIAKVMEDNNARFWIVWDSSGQKVGENMKATDNTPADSYSKLCDFLNTGTGDYVTVRIFTKIPNKTEDGETKLGNVSGQNKFTYRVLLNPASNSPVRGMNGINGGDAYIGQIMELKVGMIEMQKNFEIAGLKKEIEDLKNPDNNWQKELIGLVKTYITKEQVKKELRPSSESVAEAPAKTEPIADVPATGVVGSTVSTITNVMQGDTVNFLESIKYFAENNPKGFKEYATTIITAVDETKAEVTKHGKQ
jgi:hypothetical protein